METIFADLHNKYAIKLYILTIKIMGLQKKQEIISCWHCVDCIPPLFLPQIRFLVSRLSKDIPWPFFADWCWMDRGRDHCIFFQKFVPLPAVTKGLPILEKRDAGIG